MAMSKNEKLWVVNVVCFVLFSLVAVTGLVNWLLPNGAGRREPLLTAGRHVLMDGHAWLALIFVAAIVVHLVLHGAYIKANLVKLGWLKK